MVTLSDKQWAAVQEIVAWYRGGRSTPQVFLLTGYAGTGKSTIFKAALQELHRWGMRKHALATFMGRAAAVLRKKGNPEAQTLHSLIYTIEIDPVTQRRVWVVNFDGDVADVDLIGVDECFMVDNPVGADLASLGKKILAMGDPGQLPPINGKSYFHDMEPNVFLDEVHRQAMESPIIMLATMAREGKKLPLGRWDCGELGRAQVLPHNRDNQHLIYREETQPLCGIHRTRIGYTQRIRRLRGFEGPLPQPGEKLLIRKNDRDLAIFNGTVGELYDAVRPYKRRAGDDEIKSRYIHVDFLPEDGDRPIRDLVCDPWLFEKHFDQNVQEPRFKKGVQWVDWGNVLTMHSAQGGEWPSVTVVDDAGVFGEDQHRHRYVGCTRPTEDLTFLVRRDV